VKNFGFRIGSNSEYLLHVVGGSQAEARTSVVGITTIFGKGGFLGEAGYHFGIGHGVGFSHPEIEKLLAWVGG
jgi:hypothetical protein